MNYKNSSTLKKKLVLIVLILLLITPSIVSNAYSFTGKNYTNDIFNNYRSSNYINEFKNQYTNNNTEFIFSNYDSYFNNWSNYTNEEVNADEQIDTNTYINTEELDTIGFLTELQDFTINMDANIDLQSAKEEIVKKLEELMEKYQGTEGVPEISGEIFDGLLDFSSIDVSSLTESLSGILESLMGSSEGGLDINFDISSILGGSSSNSITPDIVVSDMIANTAGDFSGEDYRVKLSGNIYFSNPDENRNPTSNKWVVLVHAFLMSGESITNSIGQMYLDQGFNILAPDMRGFGDSEGSVALGYLESLDMWDWITYINENYPENCDEIIVHGISLGGATTVFLSGLEVNGETLKDKNVIGLVEDCGYSSMTEIVASSTGSSSMGGMFGGITGGTSSDTSDSQDGKSYIMENLDVGLTEENFDELENALNSLKKCSVPILIIHGTEDTTVPFENSDEIYKTAVENENIPFIHRYSAEGQSHAFIIMGTNYDEYKEYVENFVLEAEKVVAKEIATEEVEPIETITASYKAKTLVTEENESEISFPKFGNFSSFKSMFRNKF